jgi:hypothetical protein
VLRGPRMAKRMTSLLMALMLLFGSIGAPAFAASPMHDHATELVDLDCQGARAAKDARPDTGKAPAGHAEHHHCSIALPLPATDVSSTGVLTTQRFASVPDARLASTATLPPTPPPSA